MLKKVSVQFVLFDRPLLQALTVCVGSHSLITNPIFGTLFWWEINSKRLYSLDNGMFFILRCIKTVSLLIVVMHHNLQTFNGHIQK